MCFEYFSWFLIKEKWGFYCSSKIYHIMLFEESTPSLVDNRWKICEWVMWFLVSLWKCLSLSVFSIYIVENLCFDHITWRKMIIIGFVFFAPLYKRHIMFHEENEIFSFSSIYQTRWKRGWTRAGGGRGWTWVSWEHEKWFTIDTYSYSVSY